MNRELLQHYWWIMLVEGIVTLLFGFAAIFWPGLTLVTLIYLFTLFLIVVGVANIVVGIFSIGRGSRWFLTVILGMIELGVGVYAVRHLEMTVATFVLLAGFVLIVRGVLHVVSAFIEGATTTEKTMMTIGGVIAILAGVVILLQPTTSIAFVWILGLYALIVGPLLIAGSLDVKALTDLPPTKPVR